MAADDFHPDGTPTVFLDLPTHDSNKTHSSVDSDSIPIPPNSTWWPLRCSMSDLVDLQVEAGQGTKKQVT